MTLYSILEGLLANEWLRLDWLGSELHILIPLMILVFGYIFHTKKVSPEGQIYLGLMIIALYSQTIGFIMLSDRDVNVLVASSLLGISNVLVVYGLIFYIISKIVSFFLRLRGLNHE